MASLPFRLRVVPGAIPPSEAKIMRPRPTDWQEKSRTSFSAHWSVEIDSWHTIVRSSVKFRRLIQLLSGAVIIILCSGCEEVPSYVRNLRPPVFPCQLTRPASSKSHDVPHS